MSGYRGLTKDERQELRRLKDSRERVKMVLKVLNFKIVSLMRHVPPRKYRRPQQRPSVTVQPAQRSLF